MQEELLKRLDLLAAKLGVASSHLYEALIRQVYVHAVYAGLWFIAGVVLVFKIWPVFKKIRAYENTADRFSLAADHFWSGLWLIASGLTGFFTLGLSLCPLVQLLNPEYAAIKEILKVLK